MGYKTQQLFASNAQKISREKEPILFILNEAMLSLANDIADIEDAVRKMQQTLDQLRRSR